jgi:hypothetical protein
VTTVCSLRLAEGVVERCPGAACSLWDEGTGACVVESLAPDVRGRRDLTEHLLALRTALDAIAESRTNLLFRVLNAEEGQP